MASKRRAASIYIDVGANTKQLTSGLGKARAKVNQFQRETTGAFKKIGNAARSAQGAFFALAGAGGMGAMVKSSIEAADAMAKTADKLGVTTDALQELRFAAARTGVDQKALDTSIQRFTRRLGEAGNGTGVLLKVLEKYNIAIRDSSGKMRDTESVLADYSDAMMNATSQQERLSMASSAFDMEGVKLVNTLSKGAAGLRAGMQAARDAGAVMDEVLIRKAEIINDKWDTLSETIGVKFKSAMVGLADVFVDSRSETDQLQAQMDELAQKLIRVERAARGSIEFVDELFGVDRAQQIQGIVTEIENVAAKIAMINQPDQATVETPEQAAARLLAVKDAELVAELTWKAQRAAAIAEYDASEKAKEEAAWFARVESETAYTALVERENKKRLRQESHNQKQLTSLRMGAAQQAVGLLQMLGAKSKGFAKVAFIAEKALAIATTIVNTEAAATKALVYDPTGSLSSWIRGLGYASVAVIGATALAGAGGGGSGGGTAPPQSVTNAGDLSQDVSVTNEQAPAQEINIFVESGVHSDEGVIDLVRKMNELAGDGLEIRATVLA